jgi:hypothetical protein
MTLKIMEMPTWPIPEMKVIQSSFSFDHFCALAIAAKGIQWSGAKACRKATERVEIDKIQRELFICLFFLENPD